MPISFEFLAEKSGKDIEDYGMLNQSITQLTDLIREAGGHRFRRKSVAKNEKVTYYYYCSQDLSVKPEAKEIAKRDRRQMDRFPCAGRLNFRIDLHDRLLNLRLSHSYHIKYTDIQLSPAILSFISARCNTKTPVEIYRELQSSGLKDVDEVAHHQISYQWHQANESTWKCDADPFVSATKFLESKGEYHNINYTVGNVRGLGIYIRDVMNRLSSKAKELAIDATYGTNSSGFNFHLSYPALITRPKFC